MMQAKKTNSIRNGTNKKTLFCCLHRNHVSEFQCVHLCMASTIALAHSFFCVLCERLSNEKRNTCSAKYNTIHLQLKWLPCNTYTYASNYVLFSIVFRLFNFVAFLSAIFAERNWKKLSWTEKKHRIEFIS